MPSATEKVHLPRVHRTTKGEQLKTFARLRYDSISLALTSKLETVEDHCGSSEYVSIAPENSLNSLGLNQLGGLRKSFVMTAILCTKKKVSAVMDFDLFA